ncbi:MAG: murein biosynthesis integral membrane protein MurJ [Alphaproteobacteria bacterium]|nr:murein biosynthesis integral membrane protein MurJ [Alphaproteobacteria bacterium]
MGIIKAAVTVGAFTLFSRIIGYLRECIVAACLGACVYSDALLVALRIANTFRRIFAEGAFNASFLPRFSKVLNNDGQETANQVLSDIFSFLLIVLSVLSIVILLFFPSILQILVSGFDVLSEKFGLTVKLGRICFPYLILISVSSLLSGVLNTINNFALPAALYSLLSVCTGGGLLISYYMDASKLTSVHVMSYCVLFSGLWQSVWLWRSIKAHNFHIRFNFKCWTAKVKDIVKNMIPGIIGAGVWQLNMLVDTTISSYLPTGTITCMNLADRLNQFPLGTLGIALSTALLPLLSKCISVGNYAKARRELERGLLFAFFLTFFATTFIISLSDFLVAVAFQRGQFDITHVQITSSALLGFSVGLPAYVLSKLYSSVYFASGDTKTPVIFAIMSVILNVLFLVILVPFWKYFGLALCTSLSGLSNAILLIKFVHPQMKICLSSTFKYKLCSQVMASIITYICLKFLLDNYWSYELGNSPIKWPLFAMFFAVAVIVFSSVTSLFLVATHQKNWKLWKREAWS